MSLSVTLCWLVWLFVDCDGKKCGDILTSDKSSVNDMYIEGDLDLAVLLGLHSSSRDKVCEDGRNWEAVQLAEAIRFATDAINADPTILPEVTLGLVLMDTCDHQQTAQVRIEQITQQNCTTEAQNSSEVVTKIYPRPSYKVIGVVGAGNNDITTMTAFNLSLHHIPQVGFAAQAYDLSFKHVFAYFNRVIPMENSQATALGELH